jgi:hypothetical protein
VLRPGGNGRSASLLLWRFLCRFFYGKIGSVDRSLISESTDHINENYAPAETAHAVSNRCINHGLCPFRRLRRFGPDLGPNRRRKRASKIAFNSASAKHGPARRN